MIDKIVDRINTYSASVSKPVTAVEFGGGTLPPPPYVVVKQEVDAGGRGTAFRIIAHFEAGKQKDLRDYVRTTIGEALDNFTAIDDDGNYQELYSDMEAVPSEIIANNDDSTISQERIYWMIDFI